MFVVMQVSKPTDMKRKAFVCCVILFTERSDKRNPSNVVEEPQ